MRAAWFVATAPPALCAEEHYRGKKPEGNREGQFPGGVAGAGFGFALPLRPRRPVAGGLVGGIGPASAPGVAGSAGVTGAAAGSAAGAGSAGVGAAGAIRRCLPARDAPAGVNEQTRVAPSTLVSVSRSLDFFARIETMIGETPGVVPFARTNSPNCIATPV
jgi:hypothetical protein